MPSHAAHLHYLDAEMHLLWRIHAGPPGGVQASGPMAASGMAARCPADAPRWPARALRARAPCRASVHGTGDYTHLLYAALRAETEPAEAAAADAEPWGAGGTLGRLVAMGTVQADDVTVM